MTEAEILIRRELQECGAMPFARFMELALYAPGVGYYEQGNRAVGRGGDFYTSVSVGPLFGFLLATRLAAWMADWERVEVIESGAHDGRLAHDVLTSLAEHHPGVAARVRYHLIEPSPVRRRRQAEMLAGFGDRVAWHESVEGPGLPLAGCFLANELLDAFPVHRYEWDAIAGRWWESGVRVQEDRLAWCRLEPDAAFQSPGTEVWKGILKDGWICEQSPAAVAWWRRLARRLERGWLVTFDYGHEAPYGLRSEAPAGSLRAYRGHRRCDELLADPGGQDVTAHVDFGAIRQASEDEGWRTILHEPQGRCLGRWAAEVLAAGGRPADWLQGQARALQTLTHPAHLGAAFRALVQSREGGPGAGGSRVGDARRP